jgi:hypothetical protein
MLATSESSSGGIFSKLWITQQNRAEFLTFRAEFLTFRAEFLTFRFSYDTENSSYSSFFPSGTL